MKSQKVVIENFEGLDTLAKKGTCVEFFSAYQDLDVERMLSLCDVSATVEFKPLGQAGTGLVKETGKVIWMALIDAFPDLDHTIQSMRYEQENDSVVCHVVIFGSQEKEFGGIPPKGKSFESEHIFIFRFNDQSRITNISIDWNHESFVSQLQG